ncbi:MAG: YdcF family protein, partial [Opitutaceae bacterium]|nr:YdcF family protein [Opitutaceae bacterium]
MKRIRTQILRLAAFAILTWFVVVIGLILETARIHPITEPADVALVLGASAPHGVPSPVFAARIDHAIELYAVGKVRAILFTGGRGQNETLADSQAAQRYAFVKGVPAEAILIETVSRTTRENLAESHRLLKTTSFSSCLLVSDPLHLF